VTNCLRVAHRRFVTAGEEVVVGLIDVDAAFTAPGVKVSAHLPVDPLRIRLAAVGRMIRRSADVAGIGTVLLKKIEPGLRQEVR